MQNGDRGKIAPPSSKSEYEDGGMQYMFYDWSMKTLEPSTVFKIKT